MIYQNADVTLYTSSDTIKAGYSEVEFIFSPAFTGTVAGVAFTGADDYSIPFTAAPNKKLGPIPFTVTAGNVRVKTT